MSQNLVDNGAATVLVLPGGQAQLTDTSLPLPGGGSADVFVDEDGDTLVQVDAGRVTPTELLRAALRSAHFRAQGELLDLVVVCEDGYDRYVLSGDLQHRFLFTRQWQRREHAGKPAVALVGHSPFDVETRPEETTRRKMLASTLELVRTAVGAPARFHVVNVFTRRVSANSDIAGEAADRRADPGVRTVALQDADAVVASWGTISKAGLWAVDDTLEELRACRNRGARVLLRSYDGALETSGNPPQPSAHRVVKQGTRLVDAPTDWLWGAPLE